MENIYKKSVVHLEFAADSIDEDEQMRIWEESSTRLSSGQITQQEYVEILGNIPLRDIRGQGTALFCIYKERLFLITARHVLIDEIESRKSYERARESYGQILEHLNGETKKNLELEIEKSKNRIHNYLCRVISFNEILKGKEIFLPSHLMNLGAGTTDSTPFTFSDENLDLAVISLRDISESEFVKDLNRNGFIPLPLEQVLDDPQSEGDEIYAIGFPVRYINNFAVTASRKSGALVI